MYVYRTRSQCVLKNDKVKLRDTETYKTRKTDLTRKGKKWTFVGLSLQWRE